MTTKYEVYKSLFGDINACYSDYTEAINQAIFLCASSVDPDMGIEVIKQLSTLSSVLTHYRGEFLKINSENN